LLVDLCTIGNWEKRKRPHTKHGEELFVLSVFRIKSNNVFIETSRQPKELGIKHFSN